jgi:TM2 domain-containing membrane protein YozV
LAFFVGTLGIHNFYLGKTGKGIAQLVLTITVIGALVSLPWAFIEAILIVMGKGSDSDGNPLV